MVQGQSVPPERTHTRVFILWFIWLFCPILFRDLGSRFPSLWRSGLSGKVAYGEHCAWHPSSIPSCCWINNAFSHFSLRSGIIMLNISIFLGLPQAVKIGVLGKANCRVGSPLSTSCHLCRECHRQLYKGKMAQKGLRTWALSELPWCFSVVPHVYTLCTFCALEKKFCPFVYICASDQELPANQP